MKKLIPFLLLLSSFVYAAAPSANSLGKVSVKSITFPDATVQTTASSGGGSLVASNTYTALFGINASTITVSTMTIGDVILQATMDTSDSVPMETLDFRPTIANTKSIQFHYSGGLMALQIDSENNRLCIGCTNPDRTITMGGNVHVTGTLFGESGLATPTAGGIFAFQGKTTLVGGSAVVANAIVDSTWQLYLTIQSPSGVVGSVYVSSVTANTSFNILSTSVTDNSTVGWIMIGTH